MKLRAVCGTLIISHKNASPDQHKQRQWGTSLCDKIEKDISGFTSRHCLWSVLYPVPESLLSPWFLSVISSVLTTFSGSVTWTGRMSACITARVSPGRGSLFLYCLYPPNGPVSILSSPDHSQRPRKCDVKAVIDSLMPSTKAGSRATWKVPDDCKIDK